MVSEKYSFYYFREIDWNSNMINCEKSKNHVKNLIPTNFLYFSHEKGDCFRNFLFIIIILKKQSKFLSYTSMWFWWIILNNLKSFHDIKILLKIYVYLYGLVLTFFLELLFLIKFDPDTYIVDMKPNLPY